jgi:hypothetical protein
MLKNPPDIARVVAMRADYQPDLKPELKAFLGESYEKLLSTDVYAQWVRDQRERPVIAHPRPDAPADDVPEGADPSRVPVAVLDPLEAYDREAEDFLDDDMRTRLRRMGERNDETRRILAEAGPVADDGLTSEQRQAYAAAQWDRVAERTEIPSEIRARLLELAAGEGISVRGAVNALGVEEAKRAKVAEWLHRLRWEGLVRLDGKGRAAKWKLVTPPDGGDAS